MSTVVEGPAEQTAASLVSGILGDLQHLVEQQFQLTRREIEKEIQQRVAAAKILILGIVVFFLDAMMLCLTLAYFLRWMASPDSTELVWQSVWASHALVATGLTIIGVGLTCMGYARLRSVEQFRNPVTEILR